MQIQRFSLVKAKILLLEPLDPREPLKIFHCREVVAQVTRDEVNEFVLFIVIESTGCPVVIPELWTFILLLKLLITLSPSVMEEIAVPVLRATSSGVIKSLINIWTENYGGKRKLEREI